MFKNLFYFIKLFLWFVFFLSPGFTMAWNSMCFSPVQQAALMSKPKKSGLSTGKLNAQIRGLEKAINRAYGQLDDAESLLMASLDQGKLQADPYDVAGQIREYIESSQDGWDCDSSGQAFLFPSSRFFDILEQFLLPSAFGDTANGKVRLEQNEQDAALPEKSPKQKCEDGEDGEDGGTWYPAPDLLCCPADKSQLVGGQCVSKEEQCRKSGGSWNSSTKKCVSKKEQCQRRRGNWTWDGSKCVSKEDQCKKSGGTWTNNKCVSKKEQCEAGGGSWNSSAKKCVSKKEQCQRRRGNWTWDGSKCVSKEEQCKKSGGTWNNTTKKCVSKKEQCQRRRGNWTWDGSKCVSKEDQCKKSGGTWTNNKCVSKKEQCEAGGGSWNSSAKKCVSKKEQCKKSGGTWTNNKCVSKKEQCEAGGGSWNNTTKKCVSKKEQCQRRRGNWTWDGSKCVSKEEQCKKNGGTWTNNKCVSKKEQCEAGGGSWNNTTKKCVSKKEQCEANRQTWNPAKKECCPSGKSRLVNGRCLGPEPKRPDMTKKQICEANRQTWNPAKKECCPADKGRLVDDQCLEAKPKKEPCPEWKKHKAFGKNGNVRSNFCDEYASNKRNCKKALDKIKNRAKKISQLKDRETQLEDQLSEAQMAGLKGSTKDTEANGLCFDCLKRVLHASRPTTGQNVGNVLNLLTGAGMTAIGYNIGRRSQADLNMLRIQQGYESQHDYYSLMGASVGFPYMARGLHGMARTNTPVGGWDCSPTVSPYGHAYNYQHGQGFNMPYY